jgi:hypothetical protein
MCEPGRVLPKASPETGIGGVQTTSGDSGSQCQSNSMEVLVAVRMNILEEIANRARRNYDSAMPASTP